MCWYIQTAPNGQENLSGGAEWKIVLGIKRNDIYSLQRKALVPPQSVPACNMHACLSVVYFSLYSTVCFGKCVCVCGGGLGVYVLL